ncbi:MAG: GLPGLI family protein [Bacteroidetes bacterium]|nr:GLPGLI family protein [Bacteroidota bacterium]
MKKILSLYIVMLMAFNASAQFTTQGKIEYERKVNMSRILDNLDDDQKQWIEQFKAQIPKFVTKYFDLYFTPTKSIYKPGREVEEGTKLWFAQSPANENIVYTDFMTEKVKASKQVFEQKFLVEDTMRKIDWKITDEIRTIANYKCRKAVGKMFDSVVVVAFYTEDIPASGGPEMFGSLPGLILEVAIPRMNTTWIATHIDLVAPKETDFTIPEKGKKTTQKELGETVKSSFKDWGKYADQNTWWVLL